MKHKYDGDPYYCTRCCGVAHIDPPCGPDGHVLEPRGDSERRRFYKHQENMLADNRPTKIPENRFMRGLWNAILMMLAISVILWLWLAA